MKKNKDKNIIENNIDTIDISEEIMSEINSGKYKIKPRIYFVIANIFLFVGAVGAVLVFIFFFNLMIFRLRTLSESDCLCWDNMMQNFWIEFPIIPAIIAVLGVGIGTFLLKKVHFGDQKNQRLIILSILVFSILGAFFIDSSGFNDWVRAPQNQPNICYDQKKVDKAPQFCYVNGGTQSEGKSCGCSQSKL